MNLIQIVCADWYQEKCASARFISEARNYAKMGGFPFDTKEWMTQKYLKDK